MTVYYNGRYGVEQVSSYTEQRELSENYRHKEKIDRHKDTETFKAIVAELRADKSEPSWLL